MLENFIKAIRGRINRPLGYYQDICVRCGACIDACHFYVTSHNPAHIPSYRMMLMKKAMKTGEGKPNRLLSWWRDSSPPDAAMAAQLERAVWDCTGCRRCVVFCPFNLETGQMVSAGRYAMYQEGRGLEMIAEIGNAEIAKAEIIGDLKEFYIDQTKELETRLQEEWRPGVRIPVEKEGARVLYVPLVGEHAVIPVAKLFHAAGEDWTMSLFTATNHSWFTGDMAKAKQAASGIVDEARRLGVKVIAYPECGHASRTLLSYFESWFGDQIAGIERINITQLTARYLAEGRIRLKPGAFDTPLTYHDPCSLGRSAGIYDEPRTLLRAMATDFREMTPNRELNWCCGGGGGLIAQPEMKEVRMQGGQPKVEQIRRTGAKWVVSACENCKTQLEDLNEHYELGIEVKGVWDLVADALIV